MGINIPATLRALIILSVAMYIVPYDYVGISLATPRIRESLGFTAPFLPWILGAYSVTYGGCLILGGRLGDLYGRKRVLLIGLTIFGICSFLTAFSPTPGVFLAFRSLKGIGSALLSPNALASIAALYPEGKERNRSFGISSIFGNLFSVGFYLVAGTILMHGWRYLLLMNVPLTVIMAYFVVRYVPESKSDRPPSQFDYGGAILFILSFGMLSFTVANTFRIGLSSPITAGLFALTLVFFTALVFVEKRHPFPLVPLRLLKIRHLVGAYLVCFFWSASNTTYPISLYLQDILKLTSQQTSLALLPTIFTGIIISMVTVVFLNRFGAAKVLYTALITEMLSIGVYATLDQNSGYLTHVLPGAIASASSFLIIWIAVRLVALSGVPKEDHGVTSGLLYTMQQMGNSFGVPILAAVLNAATLSQGPKTVATTVYGFHWMFGTSIILVFIAFLAGLSSYVLFKPRRPTAKAGFEPAG